MPRRRSADTMEKDQQAYDLFRRGLSYRQIATQLEYRSPSTAFDAVRRAVKDNAGDPLEQADARQAVFDRLQDYRRAAQRVLTARHYVVSQGGRLVLGPDGNPLSDGDPVLRALNTLIKIEQEEARLRDLYPPARTRIEVVDDDVARALADETEREIARLLQANPGHSIAGERSAAR
jgi:transposase-like protein